MNRAKKRLFVGLLIFGVVIILLSLINYLYYREATAWEREWLAGTPCKAPCWQEITPGSTTIIEAEALLRQYSKVGEYETICTSDKQCNLSWANWRDAYNDAGGGDIISNQDSIVTSIGLAFPHYSFTLADVIQRYGEPTHVLASASHSVERINEINYRLSIFFQDAGIELGSSGRSTSARPTIQADTLFHVVSFFEPGGNVVVERVSQRNPKQVPYILEWKGYADFSEYCHSFNDPEYDLRNACE
jgi:hypothetical protein